MAGLGRRLALLSTLLALAPGAHAVLYSGNTGYRYTTGNQGYWGDDFWAYGNLRLDGGWYPNGQLAILTDSYYSWVLAPGVGLEKGFPGIGRARVGFTGYVGELRESDEGAKAYSLELGGFRALDPAWSFDLAYRMTTGDLFAGVNRIFDAATGQTSVTERWSVTHQAIASLAWAPLVRWRPRLEGTFIVGRASGGVQLISEGLSFSAPIVGELRGLMDFVLSHSNAAQDRDYAGFGLFYAFSGLKDVK